MMPMTDTTNCSAVEPSKRLTRLAITTPMTPIIRNEAKPREITPRCIAVKARRAEHRRGDEEGAGDAGAREHQEYRGERQAHDGAESPE